MFFFNKLLLSGKLLSALTLFLSLTLCASSGLASGQIIKEITPLEQIEIGVLHHKGVFWLINIVNKDPQLPITILWDKSSYTSSSGRSSRLVHVENKKLRPSEEQQATPLLAQKSVEIIFTSEDLLPYADQESLPPPANPSASGLLKLALKKNGIHLFWHGSVQFTNTEKSDLR